MGRMVIFKSDVDIKWPLCCAKCLSTDVLKTAEASSGRVASAAMTMTGQIKWTSQMLNLHYPICRRHSGGMSLANFMTRNTDVYKLFRGFVYLNAPLAIMITALVLKAIISAFMNNVPLSDINEPWGLIGAMVFLLFLFALIVWSFLKVPVRVIKQNESHINVWFQNNKYAEEFIELNRGVVIDK